MGTEEARGTLGGGLGELAGGAGGDVSLNCTRHAGPPEVGGDGVEGLGESEVAS